MEENGKKLTDQPKVRFYTCNVMYKCNVKLY